MKIGCLQFAPVVGDVDNNLNRADAILNRVDPDDLDLLVLPEMAFSGYNFKSLQEISPFLEHYDSGISALWARTQALKRDCSVIVGYPEQVDLTDQWPANPEYYNSALVVSSEGDTVANYRKTHLYYTDETWALEGDNFFGQPLPGLGRVSIGICMDLNPYKFEAPWSKFEFAHHVLDARTRLVVVSMAWITQEDASTFTQQPQEPDMNTLSYWISRLEPIIRSEWDEEVIVIFANRTGIEGEVVYAGTSAVIGIKEGEVRVYGILGRGDKDLLVVDTEDPPFAKLVYRPEGETVEVNDNGPYPSESRRSSISRGSNSPGQESERLSNSRLDQQEFKSAENQSVQPREQDTSASNGKRDDLIINVPQTDRLQNSLEALSVHTPSAPSPTPHGIRPQIPISSMDSAAYHSIHEYDPELPGYDAVPYDEDDYIEMDPRMEAYLLGLDTNIPSANGPETPPEYPGMPNGLQMPSLKEAPWVIGREDMDEIISDFGSLSRANNKRHSLRSDVSVWNNQTGRPRNMTELPTPPQEPSPPSPIKSRGRTSRSRHSQRSPGRRNDSVKARHGSRSRGPNLFNSSKPSQSELKAAFNRFEDMALRAESAQEQSLTIGFGITKEDLDRNDKVTSFQPPKNGHVPKHFGHERAMSGNSIPITMDPSVWQDILAAPREPEQQHSKPIRGEPPILGPASRSRIGNREASRDGHNISSRISPNPNINGERFELNTPNRQSRADSRGRPRSSRPEQSNPAQSTPARAHRTTSRRSRRPSRDVDLSQFRLIEDHPSPNCPVHGRRSRSRAGHGHSSSRHRTSANGRTQRTPSHQGNRSRSSIQNEPVSAVPKTLFGQKAASKSTTDLPNLTKRAEATATRAKHKVDESVDTLTSSCPPLKPAEEPKTPVAMVLVSELEGSGQVAANMILPPLKCVEKDVRQGIPRPRSSVW